MTPQFTIAKELAESAFLTIRIVLGVFILIALAVCFRRAIILFTGEKYRELGRRKLWLAGANLLAVIIMELMKAPVEKLLTAIGDAFGPLLQLPDPHWVATALIGLYHTIAVALALVLAIQIVGAWYWFIEGRLAVLGATTKIPADARLHLVKAVAWLNRLLRAMLLTILLLSFLAVTLRFFPLTAPVVGAILTYLSDPARQIGLAIAHYLPNLGYLTVIGFLGWVGLRVINYSFTALGSGTLVIRGFYPEWATPTYKLVRTLLLLFLLMVSFPYLPGANSQFFQGFSVFVGALLTLGSAGAIGNMVAGSVLTYTRAFRVGDMVRIGETFGAVLEKTLLVTRVRTIENEEVTIPNGSVLSSAVVNFSSGAATGGVVLKVTAGIGYDTDWRTVDALMREAARRTDHILREPPPQVWQTKLGDYAVTYELRAWTDRPEVMFEVYSALRRNVLDAFNHAGVEIMTPSILGHRDASRLAVPQQAFPDRPAPRGIAVDVEPHG